MAKSTFPAPARRGRVPGLRGVGLVLALVLTFLLVAACGADAARGGARVLAVFDPVVAAIGSSGGGLVMLAFGHRGAIGWATSTVVAVAFLGVIIGGWRRAPLLVLAVAVSLAVWGQIAVLSDRSIAGLCLYCAGFVCTIGLGAWYPLTRLSGFPPWPFPDQPGLPPPRQAWPGWELGLVFGLTVVALLSRVYALSELPSTFDAEMTVSMLASRTCAGLSSYLSGRFLTNSTGIAHLLPQMVLFHLFGTSVYALRLAAVLYGVAAVPLCYWLARRLGGTLPAVLAALLLIAAPEQLFWSRSENTHFAPVAVAALVTAHLGLWLSERLAVTAVLAAALWMPACRFFYAPAMILCAYPVGLYVHAMVFVRRAWRQGWYALPLLAGGAALWFVSLSIASAGFNHWQWHFIDPIGSYGAGVRAHVGEERAPSLAEALRLRVGSTATNVQRVATALASQTGFSHWYERSDASGHPTLVNVGFLVMVVLGIGYLLGQANERRAFALLLWVALGLLPALLSDDPADRRLSVMFPALDVVAAVFVAAVVRLVRQCAGRVVVATTNALLAMTVAAVVLTSLASHFLLRKAPLLVETSFSFTRPLFEESDVIFHNLDDTAALLTVFGNLEQFLVRPPCYQAVGPTGWIGVAAHPQCEFRDPVFGLTLEPQRIAALRAQPPGERIGFLLDNRPMMRPQIDVLRGLFPHAAFRELSTPNEEIRLVTMTTTRAATAVLRAPVLQVAAGQPPAAELMSRVLATVPLAPSAEPAGEGLVVTGGLVIKRPGWYRVLLVPACAAARLTVDLQDPDQLRPMLAGVHPFVLTLPDAAACALPVRLFMQAYAQAKPEPIAPEEIVSPAVVAVPAAQAPALVTYDGYGEARPFVEPAGHILDFGVDAQGMVSVLLQEHDGYRVRRFSPEGTALGSWEPRAVDGYDIGALVVAPDGSVLLRSRRNAWLFDRDGQLVSGWDNPPLGTADIAILDDGRSLSRLPDINTMAIVGRDGRLQTQWDEFAAEPGRFRFPVSVVRNQLGDLLIIENDGHALLFHSPSERFEPQFVRRFAIALSELPGEPQGVAFDGNARILVPDPEARSTLVYGLDGQRLMAAAPQRDLNTRGFGNVVRYAATTAGLYALDEARRLWVMSR